MHDAGEKLVTYDRRMTVCMEALTLPKGNPEAQLQIDNLERS